MSQQKTPGFQIKDNTAAKTIAARYDRSTSLPDPAPQPDYKDDIIDRINAEQNVSQTDGPIITIDVQPDYRYTLSSVIYHVIRIYATLEQRNNPIITPSTLTAYSMALVYAFSLISDSENIRLSKSDYADDFVDNASRRDLLIELERSFVPPFLRNILTGLMPTFDPRRPDISYVNSLAGYSLKHDYGRSFPITMFIKAHHLVATKPSNSNPVQVFQDWIQLSLTSGNLDLTIGQLLGLGIPSGNYDNWLAIRVRSLFNPVTSRSNTARPTFSPITTFPMETTNWNVNPYIYLLGADKENIYSTLTFIKSMSAIVNEQISGSQQLGSLFSTTSGVQIMTHFYHGPALPTWHYFTVKPTEKELTPTAYATAIHFLDLPKAEKPVTTLPYPEKDDIIDKLMYLVKPSSNGKNGKDVHTYIEFDSDDHLTPDVRYFDPYNYTPSTLPYTMMTGLSIETEEIDGFTVPQPSLISSLYTDNSHVLQSAVPLTYITTATSLGNNTPTNLIQRNPHHADAPKIGVSLYDLSINTLPYFNTNVLDAQPPQLYGFDAQPSNNRFAKAFSKFGFRIRSSERYKNPNIPLASLYAWSSYRYVNKNAPNTVPKAERISMLLNFRTMYGTNVTLSQSVHPSRLIPLA